MTAAGRATDGDLISVVIVTYESRGEIDGAIGSARAAIDAAGRRPQIIVVDNASTDGTADHVASSHPDVDLIRNGDNVGFGRANNQAFDRCRGDAWLLLNPDARLAPDALVPLLRVLEERPDAAMVAPGIDGPGPAESAGMLPGIRSGLGHFLFLNRLPLLGGRGPWRGFQLRRQTGAPVTVEWASAAAILVRPSAIRAIGGFDPRYFLYGEDTDLGARLGAAGHRAWLVPRARASHTIAASSPTVSTRWLDGLDDWLRASGAGRPRRAAFQLIAMTGLAVRAVVGRTRARDAHHVRRQAVGARRAGSLAVRILVTGR